MKRKSTVCIVIAALLTTVILIIIPLLFNENLPKDELGYLIIRSLKLLFLVLVAIILRKFSDKKFFIGYFFICLAWIWNYATLYFNTNINFIYLNIVCYDANSIIGVLFIVYSCYKYIKRNLSLGKELHSLAYYDPLTKLPNRNLILDTYNENQANKKNSTTKLLACKDYVRVGVKSMFIFLDIDDFKLINDNLSHHIGDLLLIEIAKRLKASIKEDDLVIRLSGDEFLIIVYDELGVESVDKIMNKLLSEIRRPYLLDNKEVNITCSFGVALYPEQCKSLDEVIRNADIAMYNAKKEGKNSYSLYTDKINKSINNRFDLINELKYAIRNNEFVVYYQAKASIDDNELTGLEALVRWNHPIRGLIAPNNFIPILEETGMIKEVDMIVFKTVCEQINLWKIEGRKPINVSVNISPLFFSNKMFITKIDEVLASSNVDPRYISIEITENIALTDIETTKFKINKLKSRNIKVFLDDFGKGYSSLNYIKNYPIDCLKIDKTFVDDITSNLVDQTLVKAMISVSNMLGIKVVCEGVELQAQLDVLKQLGCHEYQGYLLNRPQPLNEIELLMVHN